MKEFKKHVNKNKKTYTALGLVFIVLASWITVQEVNARLGAFGQIEVQSVIGGAAIVIDDRVVENAEHGISTIITDTRPGIRKITVQKEGYWSWEKTLEIEEDNTVKVSPYLVRRDPILVNLPNDVEQDNAGRVASLFKIDKDRTKLNALTSDDGDVAVWQEGNHIIARYNGNIGNLPHYFCNDERCSPEITVTPPQSVQIKTIEFFPGRSEILLLTFDEGVFALELDQRSNQNLQPLIELNGADIRKRDDSSVYVEYDNKFGLLLL